MTGRKWLEAAKAEGRREMALCRTLVPVLDSFSLRDQDQVIIVEMGELKIRLGDYVRIPNQSTWFHITSIEWGRTTKALRLSRAVGRKRIGIYVCFHTPAGFLNWTVDRG